MNGVAEALIFRRPELLMRTPVCCFLWILCALPVAATMAQEPGEGRHVPGTETEQSANLYQFNIRLLSVSENLVTPLRSGTAVQVAPGELFAQMVALPPGEQISLRRSETIIRKPQEQEMVLLTEPQMKQLMGHMQAPELEQGSTGRVMLAPTVIVQEGQTGTVTSGREVCWKTAKGEVSTEPVFEGTRISVRASGNATEGTPVDVRVQLSQLLDLKDIPSEPDGVLRWRPEEKVFVLEFSALLTDEKPHVAVLPARAEVSEQNGRTGSRFSLVSRLVRGAEEPARLSIWVISCSRQRSSEGLP
jgi:hypothetical protein